MQTELNILAGRVVAGIETTVLLPGERKQALAVDVLRSYYPDLTLHQLVWAVEDAVLRLKRPLGWRLRRIRLWATQDRIGGRRIPGHADHRHFLSPHPCSPFFDPSERSGPTLAG